MFPQEGPHTLIVVRELTSGGSGGADGSDGYGACALYACGTCHKGLCGNLRAKALTGPYDELTPYRVGDRQRDVKGGARGKDKEPKESEGGAGAADDAKDDAKVDGDDSSGGDGDDGGGGDGDDGGDDGAEGSGVGGGSGCSSGSGGGSDAFYGPLATAGGKRSVEARWPRRQLLGCVAGASSASIHNLCWNDRGELWAFGCVSLALSPQ